MPISLIGTCAAMYAFDFSINNMTLLALTLSVGFVVDDAIVMLENIVRHIEGGMRPFEAALKGSREIGFTIVSITFSLIAVFIPVLLMGGIVGRVFREFAVTIAVAIVLSGFVSLTLTPMLCARVLRGHHEGEEKKQISCCACSSAPSRALAQRATNGRSTGCSPTSRSRWWSRSRTIVGTVWLYIVIPKGFFPREDTGFMLAITEAQSDISFDAMVERQRKVAEIIRAGSGGALRQFDRRRRRPELHGQPGPHARWRSSRRRERGPLSEVIAAAAPCRPAASPAWPSSSR